MWLNCSEIFFLSITLKYCMIKDKSNAIRVSLGFLKNMLLKEISSYI